MKDTWTYQRLGPMYPELYSHAIAALLRGRDMIRLNDNQVLTLKPEFAYQLPSPTPAKSSFIRKKSFNTCTQGLFATLLTSHRVTCIVTSATAGTNFQSASSICYKGEMKGSK